MSIVAIDPGTSNTGLVYMDEAGVIDAKTLRYSHVIRADQYMLMARAVEITSDIRAWIADKPHDAIVIEGFLSYMGRQSAYTFQTPYLCGYLHAALAGENIVIQTSKQVLNPKTRGNAAHCRELMERKEAPWPGFEKLTNEHLRSAACHGIYYYRSLDA